MSIIIFPGLGVSNKKFNYDFDEINKKYTPSYFMKKLKQIANVYIVDRSYVNAFYYSKDKDSKFLYKNNIMYKPLDELNINDLKLDIAIKNMYNNLDKKKYKPPYICIGYSHGIYYAIEFARQFPNKTNCIISLDGSWITDELCQLRLTNWFKKGKIINEIKTQDELDILVNNIKSKKDNSIYINQLIDNVRYKHTLYCMKHKFENITKKINYITFRDFNSNVSNDENKNFNLLTMKEFDILKYNKYYKHYWLVDASHMIMSHPIYRKQIIDFILDKL